MLLTPIQGSEAANLAASQLHNAGYELTDVIHTMQCNAITATKYSHASSEPVALAATVETILRLQALADAVMRNISNATYQLERR